MSKKRTGQDTPGEKASWSNQLIHIFCDVVIREINNGSMTNTNFGARGWPLVIEAFRKESGLSYDYNQLKAKWDNLKKEYSLLRDMIGKDTGLGWDCKKGTIDASDVWWSTKIKEFPNAKKFRNKGIEPELESKLSTIFAPIIANGSRAWAPSSGSLNCDGVNAVEDSNVNSKESCDLNILEGSGDSEDDEFNATLDNIIVDSVQDRGKCIQGKRQKAANITNLKSKKGKKVGRGEGKVGGATRMADLTERLVSAVESRTPQSTFNNPYGIQACMQLLDEMPDVPEGGELWFFASRLFCDQAKREMFVTVKAHLRSMWLKNEHDEHLAIRRWGSL